MIAALFLWLMGASEQKAIFHEKWKSFCERHLVASDPWEDSELHPANCSCGYCEWRKKGKN